ncbi:MAG: helix-turn-helix domain-containing protein [Thermomicrobium sp.]|nr:helix-turn-helix transcriptional regulator [Thermomicrobium sp.]MDW8059723.1 helix-turn-helix domain-containing protein [Thermomicrobium sp.]
MRRDAHHEANCPIARAARLLGDHWVLLILRELGRGDRRFHELLVGIGISPAVLSQRLRYLEAEGLVSRHAYPEVPPRVEYALTDKGRAALPLIEQLREYGERWLSPEPPENAELAPDAPSVAGV